MQPLFLCQEMLHLQCFIPDREDLMPDPQSMSDALVVAQALRIVVSCCVSQRKGRSSVPTVSAEKKGTMTRPKAGDCPKDRFRHPALRATLSRRERVFASFSPREKGWG
jgi:hypothetical protein